MITHTRQPVAELPRELVQPQPQQSILPIHDYLPPSHESLCHGRNIPHVEQVMTVLRGRKELFYRLFVHTYRGGYNGR